MLRTWHSARRVAALGVGTCSEAWESVGVMVESGEWADCPEDRCLGAVPM